MVWKQEQPSTFYLRSPYPVSSQVSLLRSLKKSFPELQPKNSGGNGEAPNYSYQNQLFLKQDRCKRPKLHEVVVRSREYYIQLVHGIYYEWCQNYYEFFSTARQNET